VWLPQGFFQSTGSVDDLNWSSGELVGHYDDPSCYLNLNFNLPNFIAASDTSQILTGLCLAPAPAEIWPGWWNGATEALSTYWANFDDGEVRGFGGVNAGGGQAIGFSAKQTTGGGATLGGGSPFAVASIRVSFAGAATGGGSPAAIFLKRGAGIGIAAGGGSPFTLFSKSIGAVTFTAIVGGAGGIAASAVKRATAQTNNRGGGSSVAAGMKRATFGAFDAAGGFTRAVLVKRATGLSLVASGGLELSVSIRRAMSSAGVIGAGSPAATFAKRIAGAAVVSGGGFILSRTGVFAIADIAVVAGLWLRSIGIEGVIAGGVTIAGMFDVKPASGGLIDQPEAIDGVMNPIVRIDGRRTIQ
jgi:hypothetical protein